jgi:predicted small secreted protein
MKQSIIASALLLSLALAGGCEKDDMERTGEKIEDAAENAAERTEEAIEDTGDAIEDAAEEIDNPK